MTGIHTYSTTASENVQANTGINWDEGMPPSAVNNSARQNMADIRGRWNDAAWFQYGIGSKSVTATYASSTSITLAGGDATTAWHTGRRVKAVGSSTGTIYGKVSSSSYSSGTTTTTVNFTWDSGSLSNETLTVYLSAPAPVTGKPIAPEAIGGGTIGSAIAVADTNFSLQDDGDATKIAKFQLSGLTTGTTRTLTVPDASTTIVGTDATQTLTNKTITLADANFTLQDDGDATKQAKFQASGITTGTTRTLTIPDISSTIATLGGDQSFTGNITLSGANATITVSPTGTGKFVTAAAAAGSIDNVVIGGTTPLAGTFTALTATGLADLSGASAGQIKFPATQNASSNANTLDDYEEGTFTPALTIGGASTGITYSAQAGYYTKIGNRVIYDIVLLLSSKGSLTGNLSITGLPFTSQSTTPYLAPQATYGGSLVTVNALQAAIPSNGTSITLYNFTSGSAATLTNANIGNTSQFNISGSYSV